MELLEKEGNRVNHREICSHLASVVGLQEKQVLDIVSQYIDLQRNLVVEKQAIAYFGDLAVIKPDVVRDNKRYTTAWLCKDVSEVTNIPYPVVNRVLIGYIDTLRSLLLQGKACGVLGLFKFLVTARGNSFNVTVEVSTAFTAILREKDVKARVAITNFRKGSEFVIADEQEASKEETLKDEIMTADQFFAEVVK